MAEVAGNARKKEMTRKTKNGNGNGNGGKDTSIACIFFFSSLRRRGRGARTSVSLISRKCRDGSDGNTYVYV